MPSINFPAHSDQRKQAHRRVTLLGLASLAGEDDQLGLVGQQPLHVNFFALLAQIPPPVVDDDADTPRLLAPDAGLLELGEREATALADLAVVADSLRTHSGAQGLDGTDAEGCGLGLAGGATTELASGLVEPGADASLPVLPEVVGVED